MIGPQSGLRHRSSSKHLLMFVSKLTVNNFSLGKKECKALYSGMKQNRAEVDSCILLLAWARWKSCIGDFERSPLIVVTVIGRKPVG